MLQELLLGLSGHATPLFDPTVSDELTVLTPAESALLKSASRLANLHSALKTHLAGIISHHPSLICRVVATRIKSTQLGRFQKTIVDVERDILSKNPSAVGAYDIVPLASVVGKFQPWKRRLEWLWEIACFIHPADGEVLSRTSHHSAIKARTGVALVNRLRTETQTGFSDIAQAALELTGIAERVWTRQLTQWILNGTISNDQTNDFFVRLRGEDDDINADYAVDEAILPAFVTVETAASILFLGKTVRLLQSLSESQNGPERELYQGGHLPSSSNTSIALLQDLDRLPSPFPPSSISAIISQIRGSVASEVVNKMLPVHTFMRVLTQIRQYFLAGRGDFVDGLIAEADEYILTRHKQMHSGLGLAGLMIKEGEVRTVLSRTWTELAPFIGRSNLTDDSLDWAREHVVFTLFQRKTANRPRGRSRLPQIPDRFSEFLLLTPAILTLRLEPTFELFLSDEHIDAYSSISSYLIAIRRGHNHLSNLWRQAPLRRDHPAPSRPRRRQSAAALEQLRSTGRKQLARMQALRKCWTICTSAVCLLAELGAYLSGEVVERSWAAFESWAVQKGNAVRPLSSPQSNNQSLPHDPEVLATAHRTYLGSLLTGLLLTEQTHTKPLRKLLVTIETVVPAVQALHSVQHSSDLQDQGVFDDLVDDGSGKSRPRNLAQEERDALAQVVAATAALAHGVESVLDGLKRSSAAIRSRPRVGGAGDGLQPFLDISGVDRLLMRLGGGSVDFTS